MLPWWRIRGTATPSRRFFLASLLATAAAPACRAASAGWRHPGDVAISADDIAWFRSCRSRWIDSESGAPALLPSGVEPDDFAKMTEAQFTAFGHRIEPILCALFLHASFEPGRYAFDLPLDGHAGVEVTSDDIRLLQATSWRTFAIDGKRPYGDFTYFEADMARVLGLPVPLNDKSEADFPSAVVARMDALHRKMQFVLQAYVENAWLSPGRWFIPFDGWDQLPRPRCRPVSAPAILAYRRAMAVIALRGLMEPPVNLVIPKLEASANLFAVD